MGTAFHFIRKLESDFNLHRLSFHSEVVVCIKLDTNIQMHENLEISVQIKLDADFQISEFRSQCPN